MRQTSGCHTSSIRRFGDQDDYSALNKGVTLSHNAHPGPSILPTITDGPPPATSDVAALVEEHLPLVGIMVSARLRNLPPHVRRDELMSAGMVALVVSARAYQPHRGVPFRSFAAFRIRGALIDELRGTDRTARSTRIVARDIDRISARLAETLGGSPNSHDIAAALGISTVELDSVHADLARGTVLSLPEAAAEMLVANSPNGIDGPESLILHREQLGYLHDAVAALPERLRYVISAYYFAQRSMSDIAAEMCVSSSRVSQLCTQATALIRDGLNSQLDPESVRPRSETVRAAAARSTYVASLAGRSTMAGRLDRSTLHGDVRDGVGTEYVATPRECRIA